MPYATIIAVGDFLSGGLDRIAREFGWSVTQTATIDQIREVDRKSKVVAVLFEARSLGMKWEQALQAIREAAPSALPIVCHRFSEEIRWPDLASAGAFHALSLPLDEAELRQSLGFVWAAKSAAKTVVLEPQKRVQPAAKRSAHAAGFVA